MLSIFFIQLSPECLLTIYKERLENSKGKCVGNYASSIAGPGEVNEYNASILGI